MKRTSVRLHRLLSVFMIVGLILMLTGCQFLPVEEEALAPPLMQPARIEYRTAPAERGTLIQQLRLTGSFYPEIQETLTFTQGGRLKEKHVRLGQQVAAGDLLVELDSASLEYQVALQELEMEKSRLTISQLRANRADTYAIRRAQLDLEQQELRLQNLQDQLAATRIVAPFDGEITFIISTSIGEYVNAYQIVVRVADLSELVLVTTQDRASDLPIGAQVTLEYQREELIGKVVANPSSLFNDPDERLRRAAIIKAVDEWPDHVKMGSDARIIYIQDIREDVIILPRRQINLMSGRRYVNVLEDGVRVEKDVEIGLMTDTEAEIIKGLDEGDLVIVN